MLIDRLPNLLNPALIAFAVIFFGVGCFRIVEFKAAGINVFQRRILIPLHVLGCACFAGAMALFALDPQFKQKLLMQSLFIAAVLILFPSQIYVALKRRIRLTK